MKCPRRNPGVLAQLLLMSLLATASARDQGGLPDLLVIGKTSQCLGRAEKSSSNMHVACIRELNAVHHQSH